MGKPAFVLNSRVAMLLLTILLFCQAKGMGGETVKPQIVQTSKQGAIVGGNRGPKTQALSGKATGGTPGAGRTTNAGKSLSKSATSSLQKPEFLKIYDTNRDGTIDSMEMREFARQRVHRAEAIRARAPSVPNASVDNSDTATPQ